MSVRTEPDSDMGRPHTLSIAAAPEALLTLTPIFREGVGVSLRPGLSLRQTMIQDLGFCPECVEERVQTVFLDGSPVDDIDADTARQGCTLALAGALPGVAGIAMRRGSPVGVYREGITHAAASPEAAGGRPLSATLKLFNSVALECLAHVLEQGAEMAPARLAALLAADAETLPGAGFVLDGAALDRGALIAALTALPGRLRVTAEAEAGPHPDLQALAVIAEAAGAAILRVRGEGFDVILKDDASPVTRADLASHEAILAGLAERFPGVPTLSEEGADIPYDERRAWPRLFIVDPLDGTKEFVKGLDEFCVCIALAKDGYPALGCVHAPARGVTHVGGLGRGAFRREVADGIPGPWRAIRARRPDPQRLVVVGSRSHPAQETEAWLAGLPPHTRRPCGSAIKFCLLAEGAADLFPRLGGRMREWDSAAGQAVLEGAGGSVTTLDGQRLRVNKPDLLDPDFIARGLPEPSGQESAPQARGDADYA